MQIKRKKIEFHNVISIKSILENEDWFFLAEDLRKYIVEGGLYQTGPVFYQIKDVEESNKKEYTIFMPINALVNVKKESNIKFYPEFKIEDALVLRHADITEGIEPSYALIEDCATKNNINIDNSYYNIFLNVYGEGMIDIVAPIKEA